MRPNQQTSPGSTEYPAATSSPARPRPSHPERSAHFGLPARRPVVGDLYYGQIAHIGQHRELENRSGRIHNLTEGAAALFVYGNRYAVDAYEALAPDQHHLDIDLVARSGVIGEVHVRSNKVAGPTTVNLLGQVTDAGGTPVNTRHYRIEPPNDRDRRWPRSKLILVIGTSMNAGKSTTAVAIAWALTAMGHKVRAAKITGTASLKEILHAEDAGATHCHDFTSLGWPSTYLLDEPELMEIFDTLDLRFANNPANYWIVEIADGLLQRETAILLANPTVQSRIHRLVLCATDPVAALGALHTLDQRCGLEPDAISGLVASSPLGLRELGAETRVPALDATEPDLRLLADLLVCHSTGDPTVPTSDGGDSAMSTS